MKFLSLFLKRISSNPFLFIAAVFQTAIITTALVGIYNVHIYSHYCLDTVKNGSGNRFIYRLNPSMDTYSPGSGMEHYFDYYMGYIAKTDELMSDNPHYLGVSYISDYVTYLKEDSITEGEEIHTAYNTTYYNTIMLQSFKLPLEKGNWDDLFEEKDGFFPCVLGGPYANQYQIGDIIHGECVNHTGPYDAVKMVNIDYVVVGILKDPVFLFKANYGQTDKSMKAMPLSRIYEKEYYEFNVTRLITNSDLVMPYGIEMEPPYGINMGTPRFNHFIFFDSETTNAELYDYAVTLGDAYASTDTQLISAEEEDVTSMADTVYPFCIILFIVSLSATVSMSVISFLEGMDTYAVYFIFGCTRRKTLLINILYSLTYIITSAGLTVVIMRILHNLLFEIYRDYFLMRTEIFVPIVAAFIIAALISILIPYIVQRRRTIKSLVLKTPN